MERTPSTPQSVNCHQGRPLSAMCLCPTLRCWHAQPWKPGQTVTSPCGSRYSVSLWVGALPVAVVACLCPSGKRTQIKPALPLNTSLAAGPSVCTPVLTSCGYLTAIMAIVWDRITVSYRVAPETWSVRRWYRP